MKAIVTLIAVALACSAFAGEAPTISFRTKESTEEAKERIRSVGIDAFMDEAWACGAEAPRIHSLFWVEHLPPDDPGRIVLETAYRDFGFEVARRLDDMAVEFQLRTLKTGNRETLEWLLRFAKWVRTPGGYENYRMSRRAEGLAVMALGRLVADMDEDVGGFDKYVASFLSERESAVLRADILFEESFGEFDVRRDAKRFTDKGSFEMQWCRRFRKPFEKYSLKMEMYSANKELFRGEDMSMCFFAEDSSTPEPRCISNSWGLKQHFGTCIFGGILISMDSVVSMYKFRKVIGGFPTPPPGTDDDLFHAYHDYYSDLWTPYRDKYGRIGGPAGSCYYAVTHDEFMDFGTFEIIFYMKRHDGKTPWSQ